MKSFHSPVLYKSIFHSSIPSTAHIEYTEYPELLYIFDIWTEYVSGLCQNKSSSAVVMQTRGKYLQHLHTNPFLQIIYRRL